MFRLCLYVDGEGEMRTDEQMSHTIYILAFPCKTKKKKLVDEKKILSKKTGQYLDEPWMKLTFLAIDGLAILNFD